MKEQVYYFVEGKCEKTLIDLIKSNEFNLIIPGVCKILNVITHKITNYDLQNLKNPKKIILIYDTDNINSLDILNSNLTMLKKTKARIVNLHSVLCFEDELIRATNINSIHNFFNTNSLEEFKTKFISSKNLKNKLFSLEFDINKMWNTKSNLYDIQSSPKEIIKS